MRETVVPLYLELEELCDGTEFTYTYSEQEELFEDVAPFIDGICPEFAELFGFMTGNGLIDMDVPDTAIDTGFTSHHTTAGGERFVYIYNYAYLDIMDPMYLVHEFGHASAAALVADNSVDLDLNEVQSMGLEGLLALHSGTDPDGDMRGMALVFLRDKAARIVEECFWDDFQRMAHEDGADSAGDLDAILEEVSSLYGIDPPDSWSYHRNFVSPFYGISYSVSSLGALCIFAEGLEDYGSAVDLYLDVAAFDGSYTEAVVELDLANPMDAEDIAAMAAVIDGHVSLAYGA